MGSTAVRRARSRPEIRAVRELLDAYVRETAIDAERHGLAAEIADLPGAFAPPRGALLLAREGGQPAGCLGLRPAPGGPPDAAEIKRLFVAPSMRGRGVGRLLVKRALRAAREGGYARVRLDTLPSMDAAIGLYRRMGFSEIPAYHVPLEPGTLFMELRLPAPTRWRRGEYVISTDARRLDLEVVHRFLATAYWSPGVPREVVERAARGSLSFGLYHGRRQVGFARVVTDRATFGYLADVFVLPEHRGRGLGKWIVEVVLAHPELQGLRRFMLATRDAHGLYAQHGFVPLRDPSRFMERHDPDVYRRDR